jgi:lipoprotein-anchoring transpeptidase ErfK/SrfK
MKSNDSPGCSRLSLSLWLLPLCIGITFAYFFYSTPPANAAIFVDPTATQEDLWAYVNLPKPTYTPPIPPPTETPLPTQIATEPPAQLVMEAFNNLGQSDVQLAPAPSYGGAKYILVDISEQHMYVYDGDQLVYSFVASTGIGNSTRIGTFAVQSKIPNAYGSTWNIWMPNWLGIYWSHGLENGIHALPILPSGATLWAGFLGRPVSYGCVVLDTYEAQLLYDWVEIGTPVDIQW